MTTQQALQIPREQLGEGSPIALEIIGSEQEMYYDMAATMLEEIKRKAALGENAAFICPVGPVGYLKILARMVNTERIALKHVHIFMMDEYLNDDLTKISEDNPLSFTGHVNRDFFHVIDPALNVPEEQRHFPTPGKESDIWRAIQEVGGIDIALGGIGITGHIAFNEPPAPEDAITDEEFRALPTRVLRLTTETRTINAYTAARGTIELIPRYAVTIGMKEILSARKIRFYCNREWQCGVIRKLLHGPVSRFTPASFFQTHPDAKMTICPWVADPPIGELR